MVFAKSTPIDNPETLFCHTNNVLKESEHLKDSYGAKIIESIPDSYRQYFWDALFLVCKAHDLGKVQSMFQNKILKACKRSPSELLSAPADIKEIPHNIISPAFIYNHVKVFPKEIRPAIYQATAFHHSRGKELLLSDRAWIAVDNAIKKDVSNRLGELGDMQSLFNYSLLPPSADYLRKLQENLSGDVATFYIMLKGLLHRADHSGSAHFDIEVDPHIHSSHQVIDYLLNQGINQNDIWQIKSANPVLNQSVVLQAGTGSGKTEFALYWIGKDKAFYTLPMRTSVNAMYERLKETYNSKNIGLLHGDSALYVLSSSGSAHRSNADDGLIESLHTIDASKQLSMPISVCTADQIFTATFKYGGYEKIFATLAYSRLVVDEIQSYDPDIVAIILKTLVDLSKIGCRFCVITATLPKMYLDYLIKKISTIKSLRPRFRTTARHRVKSLPKSIDDPETINLIINLNKKHGGVLVITNTVKMAKKVKTLLSERNIPSYLLHSMLTYEDREFKEQYGILNCQKGIWITTQLAEVSLNIDFNVMVTEISTIDSQVQRWGRVWRNRREEYTDYEPNIYITSTPSDNGRIYYDDLVTLTYSKLSSRSSSLLSDVKEFELVQSVFSNPALEASKYKSKFDASIRMLEEYGFSVDTKGEAQQLFRHISNVTVIPSDVYFNNQSEIDQAVDNLGNRDRLVKLNSLLTIRKKTVTIPYYYFKEIKCWPLPNSDRDVMIADMKYSFEMGAELAPVSSASFI